MSEPIIQYAAQPRKIDIIYDDVTHTYRRGSDGKLFAGVSTVSSILSKPYLLQWAANLAAYHMRDSINMCKVYSTDDLEILADQARKLHTVRKKEAGDIGKAVHEILEKHVKARIADTVLPDITTMGKIETRAYGEFLKWEKDAKVEWKACELLVADMENEYAGRLDALAIACGRKTLFDWKTSNSIGSDYYLQTGGYLNALWWMGSKCEDRIIIRLPKTDTRKVFNKKTRRYTEEVNNLEVHQVPTDARFDIETFLHCRQVYKWINQDALKSD